MGKCHRSSEWRLVPERMTAPVGSVTITEVAVKVATQPCTHSCDIEAMFSWRRASGNMCARMCTLLWGMSNSTEPREWMVVLLGSSTEMVGPDADSVGGRSLARSKKSVEPESARAVVNVGMVELVGMCASARHECFALSLRAKHVKARLAPPRRHTCPPGTSVGSSIPSSSWTKCRDW